MIQNSYLNQALKHTFNTAQNKLVSHSRSMLQTQLMFGTTFLAVMFLNVLRLCKQLCQFSHPVFSLVETHLIGTYAKL